MADGTDLPALMVIQAMQLANWNNSFVAVCMLQNGVVFDAKLENTKNLALPDDLA